MYREIVNRHMEIINDTIYFESDTEFEDFCIAPYAVTTQGSYKGYYSAEYKKCLEEDKTFVIKDIFSQVYKHQCVVKRVPVFHEGQPTKRNAPIQLKVQGLRKYYGEKLEEKIRAKRKNTELKEKIVEDDCKHLIVSDMQFPTWTLFERLVTTTIKDFPSSTFGSKPLTKENNTLGLGTRTSDLLEYIKSHEFVGIDIPVLLCPNPKGESIKTIVIVGKSPLRDTKNSANKNSILLGTPYAVHQQFDCPPQCNVYKKIFNGLLSKGFSLYLTDIIKVWWKDKTLKVEKEDMDLFKEEMKLIEGELIYVAWGKNAKEGLKKMGYKPIELPHPSKQNWEKWKLKIFEKAVFSNNLTYATSIYPSPKDTTTDSIVAKEALIEIEEGIKKYGLKKK